MFTGKISIFVIILSPDTSSVSHINLNTKLVDLFKAGFYSRLISANGQGLAESDPLTCIKLHYERYDMANFIYKCIKLPYL